ncbi:hypothetical protein TrLO_g8930 [Triparma laevis f. longispina]|uniref:Uncharacterized protein n=1 Tax=Triparma laevis f. longispina TaxID=1714387 RepID=A0A9W7FT15_9STRA|nr:hypothetical protein TrLO_g8930 [Triparma laevis f. longispina]
MSARLHGSIARATGDVKMGAGVRRTMALLLARSFGVVSTAEPPRGFGGLEKVTPIVYMSSEGKGVVGLGDVGRSEEMGDSLMVRALTVTIPSFFETLPSEGWTTSVISCRTSSSLNSSISSLYGTLPPILILSSSKSLKIVLKYLLSHPLAGLIILESEELRSAFSKYSEDEEKWNYLVEGVAVVPTVRVKMVEGGGGGGGGGGEVDSQLEYLQDQLKQGRMHYAPTYLSQDSCNRVGGDKGNVTFKKVKTMLDEVMEYHAGVGMCGLHACTKGLQCPRTRIGWVVASKKNIETLSNYSSLGMGGVSHPSQLYAVKLI